MRTLTPRSMWTVLLVLALTLTLGACSKRPASTGTTSPDASSDVLAFEVCVSNVPNPSIEVRECAPVDLEYVVIAN